MGNSLMLFIVLSAALFTSGCAHTWVLPAPGGVPRTPAGGDLVDTAKQTIIPFDTLVDDLRKARVVYLGEFHTSAENHLVQQRIIEALYRENPSLIIGVEMFPRSAQSVLDRWRLGLLSEERFLEEAEWKRNWGYPYRFYRPIFTFARDHRIRIAGLNAPGPVVKKIAREGIASLTPEESLSIAAPPVQDNPEYRKRLREIYNAHVRGKIKNFDTFLMSQLTWDETMAESVATLLAGSDPGDMIVVLLGNGHISRDFGVPQRAGRRLDHTYKTLASVPLEGMEEGIGEKLGDYALVLENAAAPPHRGRLGVMLRPREDGGGLEILGVLPESRAEKAGIRKGDLIVKVNGKTVPDLETLHGAMAGKGPRHGIRIKRGTATMTLSIDMERK